MENGITPVMNVGGYGNNGFGFDNEGIWLFAILALMWGGGGLFGNNRGGYADRCATVEDLANQSNFTRLEDQVRQNGNEMSRIATNIYNGICDLGYKTQSDFAQLSNQIAQCCCNNEKIALENRYLSAQNTANINANTTAGIQKILDKLCQDKVENMQSRINQLELQQAMCGVIRYPQNFSYSVGTPFNVGYNNCGCGCGC